MSGGSDGRLTPFDKLLHRGERDPRTRSAGLGIDLLDVVPDWERFVAAFDRASRVAVRLRERIVSPTVPVTAPRWVVDPDFDLRYHLRRVALPGDGSHRELLDLAEQIAMTPLDLTRPLWTVTLVEGLDGGGAAVVTSMSHVVSDGLGMVAMFESLYDTDRAGRTGPMPLVPVPTDLDPNDLAIDGLKALPGLALGVTRDLVGAGLGSLTKPLSTVTGVAAYASSLNRVVDSFSATTPSPLLARRGIGRRMVTHDVDFRRLRAAAHELGGSVNDAYLAAVCAILRRYHEALGLPVDRLPMSIPVSLRTADDPAGGNKWTGMAIPAPVGEPDPAARISQIHAAVASGRAEPAADVLSLLSNVTASLPDAVYAQIAGRVRPADVQASNVPSYPVDTYLAGAKVLATYAMGPLPGIALMMVMVTRAGTAFIGARYDTDSIREDEVFERCVVEGFEEVLAAGGQPAAPVPVKTRPSPRAQRLGGERARTPAPTRKAGTTARLGPAAKATRAAAPEVSGARSPGAARAAVTATSMPSKRARSTKAASAPEAATPTPTPTPRGASRRAATKRGGDSRTGGENP
ncbi:MAG: DUF1298 domain-containing protein [Tetrasphaera sp.]|jgi:diacylglycerol O-acyltransferase|nr:DUF1298 domain-containing protein [Tetrasphaera sp.]